MRLYSDLASWYPLLTPLAEYAEEAEWYRASLLAHLGPGRHTLLELGCGAGHNAHFLSSDFALTLVDLSPTMLALTEATCPGAARHVGDLRSVRLGQTFDAVLIHDAIVYMLTEADLRAALTTAFVHLRPGGVAVFAPDALLETFEPSTDCGGSDGEDGRSLRYLEWVWQREGEPDRCVADYTIVMRTGEGEPVLVNDRHEEGLFSRATWLRLLAEVGFTARGIQQPYEDRMLDLFVGVVPTE